MVRGVKLENSRNKILQVGDCRIHIYGETKPCGQMETAYPGLMSAMASNWRGGAYGKIIEGGTIQIGDTVTLYGETIND